MYMFSDRWQQCTMVYNHLLMLNLLWSLVEVHSQSFPRLSFNGTTLANHSYVNISLVGRPDVGGEGVKCITDLDTCCASSEGGYRGDWYFYFPDGDRLPFSYPDVDTFEVRGSQIRRNTSANSPTVGIYRCHIPTIAVHDDDDTSVRDTVYVGLYTDTGDMCCVRWSHRPKNTEGIYSLC